MQQRNRRPAHRAHDTTSSEALLGKNPPANLEAERAVLGALLLNDEWVSQVAEILQPEDFYNPQHKIIFEHIMHLAEHYKRVDLVTLQDELNKKELLDAAGGKKKQFCVIL